MGCRKESGRFSIILTSTRATIKGTPGGTMVAQSTYVRQEPVSEGSSFVPADPAWLVLEDGVAFQGVRIGTSPEAGGEVGFTPSLTWDHERGSQPCHPWRTPTSAY